MSKLSFRAKALDAAKPMPVYNADDLPDLSECASINRAVPQMPTGMEKEEEMELHLQQVLSAQQAFSSATAANNDFDPENVVIPIPKVSTADVQHYEGLYRAADFRLPKQFIKVQAAMNLEEELPDYDIDHDDEQWLNAQTTRGLEISERQFERMMDRLEKSSEHQVVKPEQAKGLLNEDDDVILAVYDYWLNKKLKCQLPLISQVKTEKRDAVSSSSNPYVAFRRRAEKMQTRKNRKNDEESYEKMLRIRSDLRKAVTLLEMIKRREKSKRELLNLTTDIFERRFTLEDWSDELFNQLKHDVRPAFQFSKEELRSVKRQREVADVSTAVANSSNFPVNGTNLYGPTSRKRVKLATESKAPKSCRPGEIISRDWLIQNEEEWHKPTSFPGSSLRLQEEAQSIAFERKTLLDTESLDGKYSFKRCRGCQFFAAEQSDRLFKSGGDWGDPLSTPFGEDERTERDPIARRSPFFRYTNAYLHSRKSASSLTYVGLVRRRMGRGGRVVFDRVSTQPRLRQKSPEEVAPSTSAVCSSRHDSGSITTSDCDSRCLPRPGYLSGSSVFRPASPAAYSTEWLDDGGDQLWKDTMWGPNSSVGLNNLRDGDKVTTVPMCATALDPPQLNGIRIGVPASLYGILQDQLASWKYQQAEHTKTVQRQESFSRNRLVVDGKPLFNSDFHLASVGRTDDLIDSSAAHLACSAVMIPRELLKMIADLSQVSRHSSASNQPVSLVQASPPRTTMTLSGSGGKGESTPVTVFSGNGLMGSNPTGTKTISLTAVSSPGGVGGPNTVILLKSPQSKLPNGSNGQSSLTRSPLATVRSFQLVKRMSRPHNAISKYVADYGSSSDSSCSEVAIPSVSSATRVDETSDVILPADSVLPLLLRRHLPRYGYEGGGSSDNETLAAVGAVTSAPVIINCNGAAAAYRPDRRPFSEERLAQPRPTEPADLKNGENGVGPLEMSYPPLTPSPSPNSRLSDSSGSFILKLPANNNLAAGLLGSPKQQGSELHLVTKNGVT